MSGPAARKDVAPLIIYLGLAVLGLLLTRQYGESWDELQFYKYADHALESYGSWLQRGEIVETGNTYDNYGPAFVIATQQIARALNKLNSAWLLSDVRHYVYFLTFLGGVAALHSIARRWMSPRAAFAAALLFLSQPLFWGHAFISPKDMPFLSLFLIALALGLRMVDSGSVLERRPPAALRWLTGIWISSLLILFFMPRLLDGLLVAVIRDASAHPEHPVAFVLRAAASDFGQVDTNIYVQKARLATIWSELAYLLISTGLMIWIYRTKFPTAFSLFDRRVLLASLALGLATSVRILGPLAGLLVAYHAFRRLGRGALPMVWAYGGLSLAVMLAAWPYLWPDPPARLVESFRVMAQYPWNGQVLFNGAYYASTQLPVFYLPVLLAIQFTEPVWPLFVLGLLGLRKGSFALIALLLWLAAPLIGLIATRAPLYDNTRQILFLLPPVFLVAGLGVDRLLQRVPNRLAQTALVGLLTLPGLIAGARLHPYEYVYYNSLVREPEGRFELDYWGTSYRQAAEYLNETAPANSKIAAIGPGHIAELYIDDDLTVLPEDGSDGQAAAYAIITSRYGYDRELYPQAHVIYAVERTGMTFSVIKELTR